MLPDSRLLFVLLLLLIGLQRLGEMWLSRRNELRLRARGGVEKGRQQIPWMIAMHALFPFTMVIEVYLLERPFITGLAVAMVFLLLLAQGLRLWAVATLGDRWTVSIMVVPGEPRKRGGPYRHLRHPNYLAVAIEMAALPLVHTAWLTAAVFSILNCAFLRWRIREEEKALRRHGDDLESPAQ